MAPGTGRCPRAAQTAAIIAEGFPDVPVTLTDLAGDYMPSDPDPVGVPPDFARLLASYSAAERAHGARLASAAIQQFTQPVPGDGDTHELVVTHNFLIGYFVAWALDAPPWRWMGLSQMNAALTIVACQSSAPPRLISFNDAAHLPPALRWTGFPLSATPLTG
jgi:probable phosphoglycerate mutase